jgi:hypothetical protein
MTSTAQLDALIDQLTVDTYGDEEQLAGFLTGAEEALRRGEPARIVGVDVAVFDVDVGPDARTGFRLKIVVSPVRVRVSPSRNGLRVATRTPASADERPTPDIEISRGRTGRGSSP